MPEWFTRRLTEAAITVQSLGGVWESILAKGANSDAIVELESKIGLALPKSHRNFLLMHDGARFSINVSRPIEWSYQVSVLSVESLFNATCEARRLLSMIYEIDDSYGYRAASIVAFASYGASGDNCIFSPYVTNGDGEYRVLDAFHEAPGEWLSCIIAESFDDWIRKMLDSVIVSKQLLEYWTPTLISEVVR